MEDFGVTILLKSMFDRHQKSTRRELLTVCTRPAPMLKGEQGSKLQKQVWAEIVGALKKDVPEIGSSVKA